MPVRRSLNALAAIALAAGGLAACGDDDSAGTATAAPSSTSATSATSPPDAPAASAPLVTPPASSTPATPPASSPTSTVAPGTAATGSTAPFTSAVQTAPTPDPDAVPTVALETLGEFDQPVDLAVRPGDAAWYVVEQAGRVVRSEGGEAAAVLDITDLTDANGERGLLGLAFHPNEPLAYVNYTSEDTGATVVAGYVVAADGTFDAAGATTVLEIEQPYANHNGGGLAFGPDGYLYIGTGDGGAGGDPERRATDPFDLLGKLLRVDPLTDGSVPYSVPADNPFADGAEGAPEVWAIGLRNPWRFDFDEPTGDLWIADVGQNAIEEINRVPTADGHTAGYAAHFGWSAYEGNDRFNDDVAEPAQHTAPVWTYTHDDGCSVSGGVVYRGTAVPDLNGWYVYSDYCAGALWAFDAATGRNVELASGLGPVTAVRQGPDGEAYVLVHDGPVLRVTNGV